MTLLTERNIYFKFNSSLDKNLDFATCVINEFPECLYSARSSTHEYFGHRSLISQFCGHEDVCNYMNDYNAMQIAKENILKNFPVVGVLELYNATLQVLESKLPQYFKKASHVSDESILNAYKEENSINKKFTKTTVSLKAREIVEKKLHNEIELYHFCVQRLKQQFQLCD